MIAAGKTWVALNPRNGDPELQRIVEFTEPSAMLIDEAMAARVDGRGIATYMLDGPPADTVFHRAGNHEARFARTYLPLDATTAIKFTGGTSGIPKGVMQPYRGWNANIVSQRHAYNFTARDRYLVNAPLTHGASTYILPILGCRRRICVSRRHQAGDVCCMPSPTHEVTTFFSPPTMVTMLVEAARTANVRTPSLRNVIYGGAPMRPSRIPRGAGSFRPGDRGDLRPDRGAADHHEPQRRRTDATPRIWRPPAGQACSPTSASWTRMAICCRRASRARSSCAATS